MKPKFPVWLLFWGGLFLYFAINSCITGRVRPSKGAEYITPETNPLGFWASVIGSALVGLAFIVPTPHFLLPRQAARNNPCNLCASSQEQSPPHAL